MKAWQTWLGAAARAAWRRGSRRWRPARRRRRCSTARSSWTSATTSGASVPGADVTLVQPRRTGPARASAATPAWRPSRRFRPAPSRITVTLSGFKEYVDQRRGRLAEQRDARRHDAGGRRASPTPSRVTAERAVLQTDRADVRTEIESKQLGNLPVPLGRNYQNLFVMIPGVSPPQNIHSVAVNPARGLIFSSGGTTQNANSIRIEGAISNNLWLPHVAAYIPALEAIETRQRRHEQLRRRRRTVRRHVGERADQERHQPVPRLGVRLSLRRAHEGAALLPAGRAGEAEDATEAVRRHASAARSCTTSCSSSAATKARATSRSATRFGTVPTTAVAARRPVRLADADLRSAHGCRRWQRPVRVRRERRSRQTRLDPIVRAA